MFGSIGMPEMIIILVIALIVFGPRKLPELGRSLGKSLGEFKRASNDLRNTLEDEIRVEERRTVPAPAGGTKPASVPAAGSGSPASTPPEAAPATSATAAAASDEPASGTAASAPSGSASTGPARTGPTPVPSTQPTDPGTTT